MIRVGKDVTGLALTAALLSIAPQVGLAEPREPIMVAVTHVPFSQGRVRVGVCTRPTFLKRCPFNGSAAARKGTTRVEVASVPPGVYALQVYHDWNNDDRVDRNFLGIPKESIGFSRNAPLGLHGPSFKRAAFAHNAAPQTTTVKLHHFGRWRRS